MYTGVYNFYGDNIIRNPHLSYSDIRTINGIYTSPYNPYGRPIRPPVWRAAQE